MQEELFDLGLSTENISGFELKIYDRERCVCDCFKYRNKIDSELFNKALNAYASEPTEEPAESSSSDENESSSSSEDTQTLFQNIAGAATRFSAQFSGDNIILNSAPNGSYTISIFDMQGHRIHDVQNIQGHEFNAPLNRGAYLIRISQDGRTLGMTRAIKQK